MTRPASLSLPLPRSASPVSSTFTSPTNGGGSSPSPRHLHTSNAENPQPLEPHSAEDPSKSPDLTSLPPFPYSPMDKPNHAREPSKGFFSNMKASKSSNKVYHMEPTIRHVSEDTARSNVDSTEKSLYSLRKTTGSTPDLSLLTLQNSSTDGREGCQVRDQAVAHRPVGSAEQSDSNIAASPTEPLQGRKPKPKFGGFLTRTRSTRMDDGSRKSKPSTPILTTNPEIMVQYDGTNEAEDPQRAPKTAPLQQDRSLRDMMSSNTRNRSADRQPQNNNSQENVAIRREDRPSGQGLSTSNSRVFRESGGAHGGSHIFSNIKNTSSKAADGLGKAGKGIFGKIARSGSSNAKEEERYVLRVINLPLIDQTRRTRIARRLEDSKDKTEFWMPALPWRCIDYLNFRGCEEEGLYRVPGSDVQIRHWQKRFDQENDINLFDEEELYDINIIGSMFKAWLRELPSEVLPKEVQARVAEQCAGATEAPQLLKDELSSLPPWNYYLLFAITCHLSLLTAYAAKNKMTYSNLCICFQPALKIDAFCFQFLVQDWRNCWQGCWTEKEALEAEYGVLNGDLPSSSGSGAGSGGNSSSGSTAVAEERSLASSSSHKPSMGGRSQQTRPPPLSLIKVSDDHSSDFTASEDGSNQNGYAHTTSRTELPELAPVMPLSPINMSH
ncbi:MAG: hypothetical protein Q9161_000802 [Pseudevernia consocians]